MNKTVEKKNISTKNRPDYSSVYTEPQRIAVDNNKIIWPKLGKTGELSYINKWDLTIDESYQREAPTKQFIENMAKNWDWPSCGTLLVSWRDNLWFVVDGQGRLCAARLRDDIKELPCMVFCNSTTEEEAITFLKVNSTRRGVASFNKFKASLVAKHPTALFLNSLIESSGLKVGISGNAKTIACIATLLRFTRDDRAQLEQLWPLITHMHHDSEIYGDVVRGLWFAQQCLKKQESSCNLTRDPYFSKLIRIGGRACLQEIKRLSIERGKGGHAVFKDAVLGLLKKKI